MYVKMILYNTNVQTTIYKIYKLCFVYTYIYTYI